MHLHLLLLNSIGLEYHFTLQLVFYLFWWCSFLVGSVLFPFDSYIQFVLFNWRGKPPQFSYNSKSIPLHMSFWFSPTFLFLLLLSSLCVMAYYIDDIGLFLSSSEIYIFICYHNVTLVSSTSWRRTPSSILCMAGMLIINSLSFFFPW